MNPEQPILFFDGVCNLCNSSVNFIIDRNKRQNLVFAPLQSELGQKILSQHQMPTEQLSTILLYENGKLYNRSTAALRIARHLDGLWAAMYAFIILPRFLRDGVYDWISANRYKWFGKTDACRMPTPEIKARFLA
jgi:predicted DCC family thiol-disulfide oxidoreductase YuxK